MKITMDRVTLRAEFVASRQPIVRLSPIQSLRVQRKPFSIAPAPCRNLDSRISHTLRRSTRTCVQRGPGGGPESGGGIQLLDYALPAAGAVALLALGGPLFGSIASSLGIVLLITAGAGAAGVIEKVSRAFQISPLAATGSIMLTAFGVLLIPAFLKFGFFAFAGFLVYSVLSGLLGFGGSGGGGGFGGGDSMDDVEAKNMIVDVEAETIDD